MPEMFHNTNLVPFSAKLQPPMCPKAQKMDFESSLLKLEFLEALVLEQQLLWLYPYNREKRTKNINSIMVSNTPTLFQQKFMHNTDETLSVRIPQSNAFESVNNTASTLCAAILRQASCTVEFSGSVKDFDNLIPLTFLSPIRLLPSGIKI